MTGTRRIVEEDWHLPRLFIQKLYDDAKLPTKVHETDSGFDAYAHNIVKFYDNKNCTGYTWDISLFENGEWKCELQPGWRCLVGLGIAATVGEGYEIQIRSRSGIALQQGLIVANGIGTIDTNFRSELCVILLNATQVPVTLCKNMKIAQLVPAPILLPSIFETKLNVTDRNEDGFGSSGV